MSRPSVRRLDDGSSAFVQKLARLVTVPINEADHQDFSLITIGPRTVARAINAALVVLDQITVLQVGCVPQLGQCVYVIVYALYGVTVDQPFGGDDRL